MSALLRIGLINATVATALALLVVVIARRSRRPALAHALWLLVLLKLITPPIFEIPVVLPLPAEPAKAVLEISADNSLTPGNSVDLAAADAQLTCPAAPAGDGDSPSSAQCAEVRSPVSQAERRASVSTWILSAGRAGARSALGIWAKYSNSVIPAVAWIWVCGSVVWFSRQALRGLRFAHCVSAAAPAPFDLQDQAHELARDLGLARAPGVYLISGVISPMLWGVGSRTRLLFPAELIGRLDRRARATLLTHELAHYRRGDHWVRALELVVSGLYWWHPVVWWARRELEAAEEECCDAWVVSQFPAAPRLYAEAILETIDFLSESRLALPPVASGLGQVPFLRKRLTAIMCGAAPRTMSYPAWLAVLVLATGFLPIHPGLSRQRPAAQTQAVAAAAVAGPSLPKLTASRLEPFEQEILASAAEFTAAVTNQVHDSATPPVATTAASAWAVAMSPDEHYTITQRSRGQVFLHDEINGQTIDLSEARIVTVAFAPDGRSFASGGEDHMVRWWDCATGRQIHAFEGHAGTVQSVAFSPDGRTLVSGGDKDNAVILWDLGRLERLARLPRESFPVNCVAFSPDGQLLAVAAGSWKSAEPGQVSVFDASTLELKQRFECRMAACAVAFVDSGHTLIGGDFNGDLRFWELDDRGRSGYVPGRHKDAVNRARFSPDTRELAQVDLDAAQRAAIRYDWGDEPSPPPAEEARPGGLLRNWLDGLKIQ